MEKSKRDGQGTLIILILILLSLLCFTQPVLAAGIKPDVTIDTDSGTTVNLLVNKLGKLKSSSVITRTHVVNPEVAEVFATETMSPYWVFVCGKSVGSTQLTLWGKDNQLIGTFEIVVSPDVSGLKKSMFEVFPKENISIRSSGDFITLTGTASDSMTLTKILKLAEAFAPEKVVNLLQVGGVQQVMLEVRIAEISKSLGNELGVNFAWDGKESYGINTLDNLTSIPEDGYPGHGVDVSDAINLAIGFIAGDSLIVSVDALQEEGLLQILAKPTLIAQSGQNASFLAGGEFPFPVASSFDRFSIEWKPFGIGLNFTPTVLGDETISLVVAPEVSELDFSNSVSYAGYVVPSIETRRMSTVVELKDNQSFAIAGLLKNYVRESVKKFPILGDIPILGALFRSTQYLKDETELVVIVTPHLVKPVDADEIPLPTDSFEDPTPFELFMLGMLETRKKPVDEGTGYIDGGGVQPVVEGDYGYIIPE